MTANREQLVEEAAKAIEKMPYHARFDVTREGTRELARAALDVFEEAHTPTDDERTVINYCPEHGDLLNRPGDGADARSYRCREAHHIDEIHAGFRRTVQGEPWEPCAALCGDRPCSPACERRTQGAPSSIPCGFEPTDAQVEALAQSNFEFQHAAVNSPSWESRAEWLKDAYREEARVGLRTVLRAAAATRPQGEPTARDLLDAIYDPEEDDENDSVRCGFIVGQYERLCAATQEGENR